MPSARAAAAAPASASKAFASALSSFQQLPPVASRLIMALLVGLVVSRRGLRRGSLSRSGAAAALVAGTACLFANLALGAALLAFYFTGSALTRRGERDKMRVDLDARPGGGRRDAAQVLCTAGAAVACALAFAAAARGDDFGLCLIVGGAPASAPAPAHAALLGLPLHLDAERVRTLAVLGFVGALACVAGDTWASEVGILSRAQPRLITTGAVVPRGTSGGVSLLGTLASVAGGALVGLVVALDKLGLHFPRAAPCMTALGGAVAASAAAAAPAAGARALPRQALFLVLAGAAAGLVGSLLDSYLGATLQRTWLEARTGRVTARLPPGAAVSDEPFTPLMAKQAAEIASERAAVATERARLAEEAAKIKGTDVRRRGAAPPPPPEAEPPVEGSTYVVVTGRPWLSNEGVNLVTACVTAAFLAFVGESALPLWARAVSWAEAAAAAAM